MDWRLMLGVLVIAILLPPAFGHHVATSATPGVEGGGLTEPGAATASAVAMATPPNLDKMVRRGAASSIWRATWKSGWRTGIVTPTIS